METIDFSKKLDKLLRHIGNVRDNTIIIGEKLIENGEGDLGRQLIANGLIHDNSKFYGIEWEYLDELHKAKEPELFDLAAKHHITTNLHHPECWESIHDMSRLYIAEMVCDWAARSSEFGNDFYDWVKEKATVKYKFTCQHKIYKEIKDFSELLLDPPFKK